MRRAARVGCAAAAALTAFALAGPAAAQFCPSYTASSSNNDNGCAIEAVNGTNPTGAEWAAIFDLVSRGPAAWDGAGPTVRDINDGCGLPDPSNPVQARFPCELLKAIAMVESAWLQFCVPTGPSDQVGGPSRTIISFDCGYGIGQVTSGMHDGEAPDFDRQRVASDPFYNMATGTRILADKWAATPCVGDNRVATIEHWYAAAWAYNGLAYSNNPNNPNFDAGRGVYDPAVNNAAPYQEKVFGRVENPTQDLWPSVPLAYPNPGDVGGGSTPNQLPEPSCAGPTSCGATRATHQTACVDDPGTGGGGTGGEGATTSATGGPPSVTIGAGGAPGGSGGDDASSSGPQGPGGFDGSGGAAGDAAQSGDLEGGCGCRITPSPIGAAGRLAAGLVVGLAALRRRRSSPRSDRR